VVKKAKEKVDIRKCYAYVSL